MPRERITIEALCTKSHFAGKDKYEFYQKQYYIFEVEVNTSNIEIIYKNHFAGYNSLFDFLNHWTEIRKINA